MEHVKDYLRDARRIIDSFDTIAIEDIATLIARVRTRKGRIFFAGVGGGAAHAAHAVCDARKTAGIEAYAIAVNTAELTALINDEGWNTCYSEWLKASRMTGKDMLFVFSVGGGDAASAVSVNLVNAVRYAKDKKATVCGILGRDGGFTARAATACVIVPVVDRDLVTAHTESFQALIWHLLITHPKVQMKAMKWESVTGSGGKRHAPVP